MSGNPASPPGQKLILTSDGSYSMLDTRLDEAFHSTAGAFLEAYHLYGRASGLHERLNAPHTSTIAVLDVGLGLGYNACTTLQLWWDRPQANLLLLSLESDKELIRALLSGNAPWQTGWPENWLQWCQLLQPTSFGFQAHIQARTGALVTWKVLCGSAPMSLQAFPPQKFDFIWQDAFSPARCPQLWTLQWFQLLRQQAKQGARLATYSVARLVREGLEKAGWRHRRYCAPGHKRHWLIAEPVEINCF